MEHHVSQGFSLLDTLVTFSPTFSPTGMQPEKMAAGSPLQQFTISDYRLPKTIRKGAD